MDIAATLNECGLRSALIIDDAYEVPSSAKISPQSKTRFIKSVRDNAAGAAALREQFLGLDTEIDDQLVALLSSDFSLLRIWNLYHEAGAQFGWCKETFVEFERELEVKRAHLIPLEEFLGASGIRLETRATVPADEEIGGFGLVFIDFFLVEEPPEAALARVVEIGKKFATPRSVQEERFRPLVFLISSRADTTRNYQDRFRAQSKIKGNFFRFVEKENLAQDRFPARLERQLRGYASAMLLVDYLDAFRTAVSATLDRLHDLELTDLSLLNYLRIEGENEQLGNYLNWLLSEAISGGIQSDDLIKKTSSELDKRVNQQLDGHIVAPTNILFEIYTRAVCRYDVRDGLQGPRNSPLALGDIFLTETDQDGRKVSSYIAIVTPSSDFIRQSDNTSHVLCVFGSVAGEPKVGIRDLLREKLFFDKDLHLLEIVTETQKEYRLVRWDPRRLQTFALGDLMDVARYRRLGRLQPLFANQLNEVVLRHLGRVGVPTTPAILGVLDGSVTIRVGDKQAEFNTTDKAIFAAVYARKRSIDGKEQNVLCFTMAFVDELKALAEGLKAAAGVDATKLENVIKACDDGLLAEVVQTNNPCAVGPLIKVFLDEIKEGPQALCTVLLHHT